MFQLVCHYSDVADVLSTDMACSILQMEKRDSSKQMDLSVVDWLLAVVLQQGASTIK